ncbi:MAG: spermidine/putrescine ABC transporter substrate-binding protein [Gammaproteobacteria bacterium]
MLNLLRATLTLFALLGVNLVFAASSNVVNVYTWSQEIPNTVIAQFEKETGITVNYTSFDSNEVMFAKLRTAKNSGYDLIEPSSYYIDRMRRQNMLEKLDKSKLSEYKNLDPQFLNLAFDPHSDYSVPFIWGITGVFMNKNYFRQEKVKSWSDLLKKDFSNQLMILDDPREAFSMALLMLGYSINDTDPLHINQAYLKLRELMPNIRLFNTDAVTSILIDEDATIGIAWNGDLYKANMENSKLAFVYPTDGFEIWVDNFAILKDSPHKENAYRFLNFVMRPEIAKQISMNIHYATANLAAKKLLPAEIQNNPTLYPPNDVLRHGQFETDIGDKTFALYEKYWEQLKMGA